ncbi:hypothetical protein [Oceanicola sp. 502str15]|uniref:hypothetical protein n=1 Tax=Oceanicola sp. 502str15 TaxID=2696061 RepID=UPI00209414BE|nr:hypothetical protein [Oceanicola sp. 502str15]MCO6381214.1 hypothetical protein [Oceanicola sp. 502str15]
MRLVFLLCLALFAASCGRPLTEAEKGFLKEIHGDGTDLSRVRLTTYSTVGSIERTYLARPRTTCRELILPPIEQKSFKSRTAGLVLSNRIFLNPDWYLEEYLEGWPEQLNLVAAMFLAHEITHVWQWQNRAVTGYHPLKAAAEHKLHVDPYLFDPASKTRFLDYPYEQQASLVEEFVCCRALDPAGSRTARLRALLSQAMNPAPLELSRPVSNVMIPWEDAEIEGICS